MNTKSLRKCGVYALIHLDSGCRYIGAGKCVYHRWRDHKSMLNRGIHHSPRLQALWDESGRDLNAWAMVVLEECEPVRRVLLDREETWLSMARLFPATLLNKAHHAAPNTGIPQPPELKAKMSAKMKGNQNGYGTHYHGKLTDADIVAIMTRFANGEMAKDIAPDYETSVIHIRRIASRQIWWRTPVDPEIEAKCRLYLKRKPPGYCSPKAKIDPSRIPEIRERHRNGETGAALAKEFGISAVAMCLILRGKTYATI